MIIHRQALQKLLKLEIFLKPLGYKFFKIWQAVNSNKSISYKDFCIFTLTELKTECIFIFYFYLLSPLGCERELPKEK